MRRPTRLVHADVNHSRIAELPTIAQIVWFHTVPSTDKYGVLPRNPARLIREFLSVVWAHQDGGSELLEQACLDIESSGAWVPFVGPDGERYVFQRGFLKSQSRQGFKPWKEARTFGAIPPPGLSKESDELLAIHREHGDVCFDAQTGGLSDGIGVKTDGFAPVLPSYGGTSVTSRRGRRREGEGEEEGNSCPPPPSSIEDRLDVAAEDHRIRRAWTTATDALGILAIPKPADDFVFRRAAEIGTALAWEGEEPLASEIERTIRGLQKRGLNVSPKSVLNHVGEDWEDRKEPAAGFRAPPPTEEDLLLKRQWEEHRMAIAQREAERNGKDR